MKVKRKAADFIDDMARVIDDIENFIKGMDYDGFFGDRKTTMAVVRCLEILGEAAKHVPQVIKHKNPGIPWKKINGLRNRIAHDYLSIDLKIVWAIAVDELPKIKPDIKKLSR
jgi:uncharacterized protein with HEPN domain